ncbi:hypothetical protein JNK13_07955 [bacterium]|nr:hypothetical protein [bacterium]
MADSQNPPPASSSTATGQATTTEQTNPAPRPPAVERKPSVWDIYYPRNITGHQDAIYLASFPEIVFFWPTILMFFTNAFLQGIFGVNTSLLGWFAVIVLFFNLVALVQDFDQKKFIILILIVMTSFLALWILDLYGVSIFKRFASWVFSFQPAFSTDAYFLMGSMFLILFLWGIIYPLFDYWRLEQNEFIHYSQPVGKDMSIARVGCSIYKEIPDIFECILTGGGGNLIIKRDNNILATIRNVPFLGKRMAAIEHMLSETRVIIDKEA